MWRNLTHRRRVAVGAVPVSDNPDPVTEFEDRIRPNLGNPDLIPHYKKEAERLRDLTDDELVYIDRLHPGFGAAAELARRSTDATRELKKSLDSANNRLYWLTFVLGLYTVALLVTTLVLVFKAR